MKYTNIMDKYAVDRYINQVLYILNKVKAIDYFHLFKIMYFAQREYLRRYGKVIFADSFHALQYGPVPTMLYDAIRRTRQTPISAEISCSVIMGDDDAHYVLIPTKPANLDYIAPKECEVIDWSINQYASMPFNELSELSHTKVWETANVNGKGAMKEYDIAIDAGASPEALETLICSEQFEEAYK